MQTALPVCFLEGRASISDSEKCERTVTPEDRRRLIEERVRAQPQAYG
jgi:hypothetical protein